MRDIWVISDTHFGHENILSFTNQDGSRVRHFDNVKDMDDFMIDRWNHYVKPNDRVYHLGDVAIARKNISIMKYLNGKKVLIKGNHDIFALKDYVPYFEDIRAYTVRDYGFGNIIMSHIPILRNGNRFAANVHGHVHCNSVNDGWYVNVCVEVTAYKPIHIDHVSFLVRNHSRQAISSEICGNE